MRINSDESVVSSTATPGSGSRIQNSEASGVLRWAGTCVAVSIRCLPGIFAVLLSSCWVCIVIDKVIPLHWCKLCWHRPQRRHSLWQRAPLITSRIYEKNFESDAGESGSKGATTRARANNNIVVVSSYIAGSGQKIISRYAYRKSR